MDHRYTFFIAIGGYPPFKTLKFFPLPKKHDDKLLSVYKFDLLYDRTTDRFYNYLISITIFSFFHFQTKFSNKRILKNPTFDVLPLSKVIILKKKMSMMFIKNEVIIKH